MEDSSLSTDDAEKKASSVVVRTENSLAKRVLRAVLGIYLSIAISITLVQLVLEYRNEKNRLTSEIIQVAETFKPIVSEALWNLDEDQINVALVGILSTNTDILGVELHDPDGATSYTIYADQMLNSENPANSADQEGNNEARKSGSMPLVEKFYYEYKLIHDTEFSGTQDLGILAFITDSNVVLQRASHTFYITFASALLKTGVLWLIFYMMVNRMVGRPMGLLSRAMESLKPSKSKETKEVIIEKDMLNRADELGVAMRTFLSMKESLQEKDRTLTEYHAHLEEKVVERTRQLEEASEAKSSFLASMSHEIRTPMNGVLGMVQLLADTDLNPKQQKYINIIQNSGESLIEIINDILDHLKIEAKKVELENVPINLEKILDDCTAIFSYKSREKGVALFSLVTPDCPEWVNGDSIRLKQILNNLMANAFKFTQQGEVIVKAELLENTDEKKVTIRISVRDSGIGIAPDKLEKLFLPFIQADNSTTRKYGGTGLGLSICKQFAELMGGKINIESQQGEGSVFKVDLPFDISTEAEVEAVDGVKNDENRLIGKRLLIVDGNETFRKIISEITGNWGVKVDSVSTAHDAFKTISEASESKFPYDIVIVDAVLSDCSGLELYEKLVAKLADRKPRVMLVSTHQNVSGIDVLESRDGFVFVEKPIQNYELRETLTGLVDNNEESEESIKQKPEEKSFGTVKVLVAEDNSVNQIVIRGMLNKLGIEPDVVDNGHGVISACNASHDSPYDLILMDCEMPEMDGWQASSEIRGLDYKSKNGKSVLIYALSAHAMEKHLDKAKSSGMDGYLYKPVSIEKLIETLESTLEK